VTVAVLLVTHRALGRDLIAIASRIYGTCPAPMDCLEVPYEAETGHLIAAGERLVDALDQGDGVLVLTDLYGSTPANLAVALIPRHPRLRVLSGVNLPMLVRALKYCCLDLDQVAEKALTGGRDGVILCHGRPTGG
jgi:PTS system ascorbate-specific IIA component